MSQEDHSDFVDRAAHLKHALTDSAEFTEDEIAAMLGNFVLVCHAQHMRTTQPPEFWEMITKLNLLNDRALAE